MQLSEAGCVLANLVFYIKNDSYGEYIFDWEWAQMFHQAGLSYFPKVVVAVPFTPANGSRFLHDPKINFETCARHLTQTLMEYCQESSISSIHFLCLTRKEQAFLEKFDFLSRLTHQFHWKNNGYGIFDDFMDDLRSKRKKQIRKERESIRNQGIRVSFVKGKDVREKHIDAVWSCYQNTHFRKWGSAYLNQNFFERIFQNHGRRIILVLAEKSNEIIAASFNYHKADHLFGRYWGALGNYPNLHFECCYYQLIEFSIQNEIQTFEAGAQGEHKFLRGFPAMPVYSSHYIFNQEARSLIRSYLKEESFYQQRLIEHYNQNSPLKSIGRVKQEALREIGTGEP